MSVQAAAQKTEVEAFVTRLLALDSPNDRKMLVEKNPAVEWDEVIRVLTERVWQEVRVNTQQAERMADAAVEVAEARGNPVSIGKSIRAKANALYALDRHAAAIELHERAIALFDQAGAPSSHCCF
jgi:hypothetical protein